jgi:hypothetical protein
MTPKEKALQLYNKFINYVNDSSYPEIGAKELSVITIDEVLNTLNHDDLWVIGESAIDDFINYWNEVKKEIEKL